MKEISPSSPFETARALSQLFTVQCHQREPIQNSQLIRLYKEGNIPLSPHSKTARALRQLFTVQCHQWEPIQNSHLIRIYKEGNIPPPPIWNCQRTEWTLCCSMWSMRAHSKQSTNRKISGKVSFIQVPWLHLTDSRVTSSLFNVVHDSQRQMDPPSDIWQTREWPLHCSMVKNGNFTCLLTFRSQEWQFHMTSVI